MAGQDRPLWWDAQLRQQLAEALSVVIDVAARHQHQGARGASHGPGDGLAAFSHGRGGHTTGVDHPQVGRAVRPAGERQACLGEGFAQGGAFVLIDLATECGDQELHCGEPPGAVGRTDPAGVVAVLDGSMITDPAANAAPWAARSRAS